jgi:RNA polymerase sigma factor (sigma-70 family)
MGPLSRGLQRTLLTLAGQGCAGPLTDGQLLDRFLAQQDQCAFEEIVRRHGPMVLRVCQRILRHTQDAEDAFQATFIVLARRAALAAQKQSVGGWLHCVANRTAMYARKTRARRIYARETAFHEDKCAQPALPDATSKSDEHTGLLLEQELSRLPEKYRTVIVLCHLEGKTVDEAAGQMGCQSSAVKMRLMRARDRLRARLERGGVTMAAGALATLLSQESQATPLPATLLSCACRAADPSGAALAPTALELANGAIQEEMSRRSLLRWTCGLAALGLAGGALGIWHVAKRSAQTGQHRGPAANARVFDSTLPLLVMDVRGHHLQEIGRTPTPDGQGVKIPAGSQWAVTPMQGRAVRMNEMEFRNFVNEVRVQNIPGVSLQPEIQVGDADLARFDGLTCLERLSINSNRVTDKGLEHLWDLANLGYLVVVSHQVSGSGLAHLARLEELYLASAGADDRLAEHLKSMAHLRVLELAHTRIGEAGWKKLADKQALRRGLEHLGIEENGISLLAMAALQRLTGLKRLDLYRNDIGEPTLQTLAAMSQLESLTVDCCGNHTWRGCPPGDAASGKRVEGQLLWQIGHIKVIPVSAQNSQSYVLRPRGSLTDRGLGHLARLSQLKKLEIASDEVTAAGIQALAGLRQVQHLRLHGNQLTDSCLPSLRSLRELRSLDLIGTRITANGAADIGKLPRLRTLLLPWNCSDAERDRCQKRLPGVRVLGRPYIDWDRKTS